MPLYIADYLAGTAHLTTAEHGAYLLLIMHYWTKGGLPADDDTIRRITRMSNRQWAQSKEVLRSLFGSHLSSPKRNHWWHPRVEREIAQAIEKSRVNSANAKRSHSERIKVADVSHLVSLDTLHTTDKEKEREERKKDIGASAPTKTYAFESGIIRLNQYNLDKWKAAFINLDVPAELIGLSKWATEQGKNWFPAVSGVLAKRNRQAKENLAARISKEAAAKAADDKIWCIKL